MSQRKSKPKNRPSLAAPLATSSSIHLTSFHPSRPLYAVATTAIGQNVVHIYDTDKAVGGSQEARSEIRLARGDEVSCLVWQGSEGVKKRKRRGSAGSMGGELVCGLKSGRICVIEQASGEIAKTLEGHGAGVNGWVVDEEGGWSCAADGKVKCWDTRTGNCLRTMSPQVDGLEFTALALSPKSLFLSSSQTLYQLSKPSGDIISQITAHTTPIHTIHISPDKSTIATAAIGDRFINVVSLSKTGLARLGSLTCNHDVRTFSLHQESLLAITVIGTLEIFHDYNVNFEPGKKGGMTKPPHAEIQLTTGHAAKIEVEDVVVRGKETLICWVEGAKTGFEVLDIQDKSGKVEIAIQTRKEQVSQQSSKPYDDSKALVLTGGEPAKFLVNGTGDADLLSFADRLAQLQPSTTQSTAQPAAIIPNAASLSTLLTQALNSSDEKLLQTCFQQSHSHETIQNTLMRLSPPLVPSLLSYFNSTLSRKQKQAAATFNWIRQTVVIHGGYLVSQGEDVRQVLARLKGTLDRRGQSWERLVRLKGRLELLRAVKGGPGVQVANVPEVRWIEEGPGGEEEEEEGEIEDVRYLTGDVEGEEGESEIEEVEEEIEDVLENGIEDEEDEDEDEEDEDDEDDEDEDEEDEEDEDDEDDEEESLAEEKPKKVNGVPHFSDSEDSAVDLEDLIDDEASEASEDEDEEEEEEEEEDIPPPPKKKSKSRR